MTSQKLRSFDRPGAERDRNWSAHALDRELRRRHGHAIPIAERGGALHRDVPGRRRPVDVAVGEDGVWVASSLDRTVTRLDPETGETVATIELGNEPQRLAAGGGAVWVTVQAPEAADG